MSAAAEDPRAEALRIREEAAVARAAKDSASSAFARC
jgi:hypothetical protein